MTKRATWTALAALLITVLLGVPVARAKSWGKITKEERQLSSVPWYPEATAVILLHRTEILLSSSANPSRVNQHVRLKILTEEGLKHGTVSISSSEFDRLKDLDARVVLPNGEEVRLPKKAVFEKRYSSYYDLQQTAFVMPRVEVGAIVEWKYTIYFDYPLVAWEIPFEGELPTRRREIVFSKPAFVEFRASFADRLGRAPSYRLQEGLGTSQAEYTLTDLPPLPDEPYRPPYRDLVSMVQFIPTALAVGHRSPIDFGRDWEGVVARFQRLSYAESREDARKARSVAGEMTAGIEEAKEKARTLYHFVRDEIETQRSRRLVASDPLDKVLDDREGTMAEKVLLLQVMLEAAGISSSIGWTNPASRGKLYPQVPTLGRVNQMLVAADLAGKRIFLDPADRAAAFGILGPELEGVRCLLVDGEKPNWVRLPESPPSRSRRLARVRLRLDDGGRLSGEADLELTGHHAWAHLATEKSEDEKVEEWNEWLLERLPGFMVDVTGTEESVEERTVRVEWSMNQREEEVLGDEVSLPIAEPLAIKVNPFGLEPQQRITPVRMPFKDSSEVRLELEWPEGWELDIEPSLIGTGNQAGVIRTVLDSDPESRSLTMTRTFDHRMRELAPGEPYAELRKLYHRCVEIDAQTIVLVKRP
jgi:hypothetical protein